MAAARRPPVVLAEGSAVEEARRRLCDVRATGVAAHGACCCRKIRRPTSNSASMTGGCAWSTRTRSLYRARVWRGRCRRRGRIDRPGGTDAVKGIDFTRGNRHPPHAATLGRPRAVHGARLECTAQPEAIARDGPCEARRSRSSFESCTSIRAELELSSASLGQSGSGKTALSVQVLGGPRSNSPKSGGIDDETGARAHGERSRSPRPLVR